MGREAEAWGIVSPVYLSNKELIFFAGFMVGRETEAWGIVSPVYLSNKELIFFARFYGGERG